MIGIKSILVGALLASTIVIQQYRINNISEDRDRHAKNASSLMEDNSSINLTNKELKSYISDSESKFAKKIDSITKAHNIAIKDLGKITYVETSVLVTDTVYLPSTDTVKIVDRTYWLRFKNDSKCISATVMAKTKDPNTEVIFEKLKAQNETHVMVYKKKKKWWQLFKKREFIQKTVNSCGVTSYSEINLEPKDKAF